MDVRAAFVFYLFFIVHAGSGFYQWLTEVACFVRVTGVIQAACPQKLSSTKQLGVSADVVSKEVYAQQSTVVNSCEVIRVRLFLLFLLYLFFDNGTEELGRWLWWSSLVPQVNGLTSSIIAPVHLYVLICLLFDLTQALQYIVIYAFKHRLHGRILRCHLLPISEHHLCLIESISRELHSLGLYLLPLSYHLCLILPICKLHLLILLR